MTITILLLAVGGAFASKARAYYAYTSYWDFYPNQTDDCVVRGYCPGTGSLCRIVNGNTYYQLYRSGCLIPLNGILNE